MSDTKCAPYPWMKDKYGNVKDANGYTVKLTGFALSCGYTPKDDRYYVNTKMAIAAPELLEVAEALLEWIDSVPEDTVLPTMPGCDREWIDSVIAKAKGKYYE